MKTTFVKLLSAFGFISSTLVVSPIYGAENTTPQNHACTPSAMTEVIDARFGVFGVNNGQRVLIETNEIPAIVGLKFGWFVLFKTDKPTIVWREEFELPSAPPTWGQGELLGAFTISPDRRTAVTERIIPTQLGFFANEWLYAPGDPTGNHKIRIFIDGQLIREFGFSITEVTDPKGEENSPSKRDVNTYPKT